MEAALLMFDVAGLVLVAVWLGRGNGRTGLFAWQSRPPKADPPEANRRARARGRQA